MTLAITKLDEDKLPIKYVLGIHEQLENYPDAFDIIYTYVTESIKRPERPRYTFTKNSLIDYHSNGNVENAEKGLEQAINLGLIEPNNIEPGKESYTIKINPFQ